MSNENERLEHIRKFFQRQEKVKIEVPAFVSETTQGRLIHYFNGDRFGYKFNRGVALVDRKDLHLFQIYYPDWKIYDETEDHA